MAPNVVRPQKIIMEPMECGVQTFGESTNSYRQESGEAPMAGKIKGKGDVASLWSIESHTLSCAYQKIHRNQSTLCVG